MKASMRLTFTLVTFAFVAVAIVATADDCLPGFTFCPAKEGLKGSFADCTQATCDYQEGAPTMTCTCVVRSNVASSTSRDCKAGTEKALQSRYPNVSALGVCTSTTNPWGFCLDVKCDPGVDGKTKCVCTTVTSPDYGSSQYVIVGGSSESCASDVHVSSATPGQTFSATGFLRCKQPDVEVVDPKITWVSSP